MSEYEVYSYEAYRKKYQDDIRIDETLRFANKNMSIKTIFDERTGVRRDKTEYPILAIREAILNAVLARAMETLGKNENRYSGIPTIRRLMREERLPEPEFVDSRNKFSGIL